MNGIMMMMKTKATYNQNIFVDIHGPITQKGRIKTYTQNIIRSFAPRMRRVVLIDISIRKRLEHGYYGFCCGDRREVYIELAKGSYDEDFTHDYMMLNLAHELVHAKQYLLGQLSTYHHRWKTKDYSDTPYSAVPWEREAYKKEDILFETFWIGVDKRA